MSAREKEVADYYVNHTAVETSKEFGLAVNTVRQYVARTRQRGLLDLPDKRYVTKSNRRPDTDVQ